RATCTDIDETTSPDPINPYAETKAAAEESLDEFTAETDATGTALRLSTVYGDAPGIRFNLVVNQFVFRALTGRPLTVYGVGANAENYRVREVATLISEEINTVDVTYLEDEHPGPSYHVNFDRVAETGFDLTYALRTGVRDLAEGFTA